MDYLATGLIRTSHGLSGYVKVALFSESADHLNAVSQVILKKSGKEKRALIEDVKTTGAVPLVKFDVISSPEEGKQYSGWEIWIPRSECEPLEEGEIYQADLIGCTLYFNAAERGKVISLVEGGQAPLLEVAFESKKSLVPYMEQYIESVDTENRRIQLAVEWIVE